MKSREYYTEFAKNADGHGHSDGRLRQANTVTTNWRWAILASRVLDAGQCNDSYSLALIALKLKEVFKCR